MTDSHPTRPSDAATAAEHYATPEGALEGTPGETSLGMSGKTSAGAPDEVRDDTAAARTPRPRTSPEAAPTTPAAATGPAAESAPITPAPASRTPSPRRPRGAGRGPGAGPGRGRTRPAGPSTATRTTPGRTAPAGPSAGRTADAAGGPGARSAAAAAAAERLPTAGARRQAHERRPHLWFARQLLLALSGQIPVHALLGHALPTAYDQLVELAPQAPLRPRPAPGRTAAVPTLRECGLCRPRDGVIEAFARISSGDRLRALAFRLERGADTRWRCATLDIGPMPRPWVPAPHP